MLSRLFIAALWSPKRKVLTSWLLFVMFFFDFVTFPFGILGQVWYFIVSIPDPCCLSYLDNLPKNNWKFIVYIYINILRINFIL